MKEEVTVGDRFEGVLRMLSALQAIASAASMAAAHSSSNEGVAISEFSGGVEVICDALQERMDLLWQAMHAHKANTDNHSESEVSHAKAESVSHVVRAAA